MCLFFVGLFAHVLAPYDLSDINIRRRNLPGSAQHLLGTDNIGRDQMTKMIYSARTTLLVGPATVAVSVLVATAIGVVTGYRGGKVDAVFQRFVDAWMSLPELVILISGAFVLGPGLRSVMITIFVITAVAMARVIRSAVVKEKEEVYVEAATAMGASDSRIMFRHLLPNVMNAILVVAALGVSQAIMLEAVASYLGLGLLPSSPSFGQLIRGTTRALIPGLVLTAIIFAFNTLADAVIDLNNPHTANLVRRSH